MPINENLARKKVLLRDKSLAKENYSFCQENKVYPRKNICFAKRYKSKQEYIGTGLAKKRYRFCQEKIEWLGKGLVVSWLSSRFRLRGRSVE